MPFAGASGFQHLRDVELSAAIIAAAHRQQYGGSGFSIEPEMHHQIQRSGFAQCGQVNLALRLQANEAAPIAAPAYLASIFLGEIINPARG